MNSYEFKRLLDDANSGNSNAIMKVAKAYRYGDGTEKDYDTALGWYKKNHSGESFYQRAMMRKETMGTDDIYTEYLDKALSLYKTESVRDQDGYSSYSAGLIYLMREDYKNALTYFNLSFEQHTTYASYELANLYFLGRGCDLDYKKACDFYEMTLENSQKPHVKQMTHFRLGLLRYHSKYGLKNDERALNHFLEASAYGEGKAYRYLGYMSFHGQGTKIDKLQAKEYLIMGVTYGEDLCLKYLNDFQLPFDRLVITHIHSLHEQAKNTSKQEVRDMLLNKAYVNIFDTNNHSTLFLYDDDLKQIIPFTQKALLPYQDTPYCILINQISTIDLAEGTLFYYKIIEKDNNFTFVEVTDEKLTRVLLREYRKLK